MSRDYDLYSYGKSMGDGCVTNETWGDVLRKDGFLRKMGLVCRFFEMLMFWAGLALGFGPDGLL